MPVHEQSDLPTYLMTERGKFTCLFVRISAKVAVTAFRKTIDPFDLAGFKTLRISFEFQSYGCIFLYPVGYLNNESGASELY
ncbi:hypothetical protein [Maridesulfovibrio frigidus]|uniref:hypothetical protein n=1 Tax=Maridesulfovibrio frigidus TaxID=340956 RepID=UPI001F2F1F99|nr:hypothetical protein [Maridesulfovibrio frigidus]